MEGLASLAMAMAQLEEAQEYRAPLRSPVSIAEPSAPSNVNSEAPLHPWDAGIPFPKKQTYHQHPRVVTIENEDPQQALYTIVAPKEDVTSTEEKDIVLDTTTEEPVPPPPSPEEVIAKVEENDVLCGRGGETNNHVGNIKYRDLVKQYQRQYLKAKRREKPRIARLIVDTIRRRNGRFLKKNTSDNTWRDVGNTKAREKTSQALREGAPELRDDNNKTNNKSDYKFAVDFQVYKKRKTSPSPLGTIPPQTNLISPTPSSESFVGYPPSVSADADEEEHYLSMPITKKVKRGPRLAILKARLQEDP